MRQNQNNEKARGSRRRELFHLEKCLKNKNFGKSIAYIK
jgi:hypothetical protein